MTIQERIDEAWDRKPGKIDWLALEQLIRDILSAMLREEISRGLALGYIDEALAAHTGRGNTLPENFY